MPIISPQASITGVQSSIGRRGRLVRRDPYYVTDGVWAELSPDGTKLIYSRFNPAATGGDGTGTFQLFMSNNDGSGEIALLPEIPTVHVGMVGFHPSGDWIIVSVEMITGVAVHFNRHPGKGIYVNLWAGNISDPENPTWHQLTDYDNDYSVDPGPYGALQAKFSNDGTKVAWSQKIGFDPLDLGGFSYWDIAIADWVVTSGTPSLQNKVTYTPGSGNFYEVWDWSLDDTKLILASSAGTANAYTDSQIWTIGDPDTVSITGPNFNWDEQTFYSPDDTRVIIGSSFAQPVAYDPYNLWDTWFTDMWSSDPDGTDFQQLSYFNEVGNSQYYARPEGRVVRLLPCHWHPNGTLVFQVLFNDGSTQVHEDSEIWFWRVSGKHQSNETETVVTLGASADSVIIAAAPTTNYGSLNVIEVGDLSPSASTYIRTLIKFDVSSIPSDAIIVSAKLELYESTAYNSNSIAPWNVNVHRLLADWNEAQVTYNNRVTGTAWTVAGAGQDVLITPSATLVMDGAAAAAFVSWQSNGLRDDVQRWVQGTEPNYGWWMIAPSAEAQGVGPLAGNIFGSKDHATAGVRPKLTVTYRIRT